jgi:hypothetical protein
MGEMFALACWARHKWRFEKAPYPSYWTEYLRVRWLFGPR